MTSGLLLEIRKRNQAGENDCIIAETLGQHHSVISRYRAEMGLPSRGDTRRGSIIYTVWDAETDELLACGNSKECAAILGLKSWATFHQMVSRAQHGKLKKYVVIKTRRRTPEPCK